MKKYLALVIFIVITLMASTVFATSTTTFEVVEDNVCTIKINDYCEFEKKMISSDIDKRQVTIQMKVTNTAVNNQPSGEVMLVLDNSSSMNETTANNALRKDLVFNSAKTLVSKMLADNDNLKVGIVSFSTNIDATLEGTMSDASLVSELSTDADSLVSKIDSIEANGPRTDLEAGLTLASQYFSNENTNKYLIVLTDGVPNVSLGHNNPYYSDDTINATKAKLESLANDYKIITMLTGISDADTTITGSPYTYAQVIEKIFGTVDNPTAGNFYYIEDNEIEETVTNEIYNSLLPSSQTVTDLVINDYFPQDIVDNFDFAYVASPNIGTISPEIDKDNNRIVWTIGDLAAGETALVQYTLTLKENFNQNIIDVVLDTNEKVDITYNNPDGTPGTKTSDETPKVRVTALKGEDPTTAPKILPKTGTPIIVAGIVFVALLSVASGLALASINKKMNKF